MVSSIERSLYWAIWTGTAVYILYRFSVESRRKLYQLDQTDFVPGWSIFNRPQDSSDEEWRVLKRSYFNFWPCLAGHTILAVARQTIWTNYKDVWALIFTTYSLLSITCCFGVVVPSLYFLVFVIFVILFYIRIKIICYLTLFGLLYTLNSTSSYFLGNSFDSNGNDIFLIELGYCWLLARLLAFSIDSMNNGNATLHNSIASMLVYSFYLPVFFTGPVMSYDSFVNQFYNNKQKITPRRLLNWLIMSSKYVLYIFLLEIMLHFLYSMAVQFYPELAEQMDAWTLCGLGYALSVIFYFKYVIIYGMACAFAEIDNIEFPPPPKCVSRISLNSAMWKYFDRGLYLWIQRYLYVPLIGPVWCLHRRLFASFCCFLFMTLWHGHVPAIFLWCFLNYLAVSIEMAVGVFYKTRLEGWRKKHISECNFLRIKAFLAALSFLHLCLSCMFFLSSWEIGMVFYRKILFSFPVPLIPTIVIMYAQGHVSLHVEEWQMSKIKNT